MVIPLKVVGVQLNCSCLLSVLSYRLYFNLLWQNYNTGLIVLTISSLGIGNPEDFLWAMEAPLLFVLFRWTYDSGNPSFWRIYSNFQTNTSYFSWHSQKTFFSFPVFQIRWYGTMFINVWDWFWVSRLNKNLISLLAIFVTGSKKVLLSVRLGSV